MMIMSDTFAVLRNLIPQAQTSLLLYLARKIKKDMLVNYKCSGEEVSISERRGSRFHWQNSLICTRA